MTPLVIFGCIMVGAFVGFGLGVFLMAMLHHDNHRQHRPTWSRNDHEQHHY